MALDATRDWLKSVLRPYPARDRILQEVLDILSKYRSLAVRTDAFTFDSGQTSLLLQLHGTLATPYKGNTYHIPVAIWLPHEYPQAPPMAFVVPTKDMGVRKSREVDPGGRITVAQEWWNDKRLDNFIVRMIDVFSKQPPVYAKPSAPAAPSSRQSSISTPPPQQLQAAQPPQPPREVLPQYQPSRSSSIDPGPGPGPGSPPVPPRPGMSPQPLQQEQMPPVPQRPFPQYRQSMSPPPPLNFSPQPQHPQQQQQHYPPTPQSPVNAQSPVQTQHTGPPLPPHPSQPPFLPYPQQQQQQQQQPQPPYPYRQSSLPPPQGYPTPQPPQPQSQLPPQQSLSAPPRQDLLSSPNTETSALPDDTPPVAPPKPPPPSLIHLHAILQPHLNAALPALKHDLESQRQALLERREDLASGEPAIRDEMARLEAVKKVCDVVVSKMTDVVSKGEERVVDLERRGEVSVDEVVCGISIVHNQLIDLVAEDNALSDTIYHLTRALDAERIDLDRYLKAVRQLAREQYMKRALIEKILNGMGQTW